MKKLSIFALLLCSVVAFSQKAKTKPTNKDYAQYVNPFIGTGGHGHTFPGATVPFGMVQLSPDTRVDGSWDGCSGYHYSDSVIYGFSHTHLNGTGCSDYGDIMLMPTLGEVSLDKKDYSSPFKHANETALAGYYSVLLDNNIKAELTATPRVGFHKYTFNKAGQANIILDLNHRDKLIMGEVRVIDSKTIEVFRRSEAWARDQYIYARIEFSVPVKVTKVNNNAFAPAKLTDTFFAGSVLAISFSKEVKQGEELLVKVALSPTGYEGAAKNMKAELPGWDFGKTVSNAQALWNKELGKIEITEKNKDKNTVFYTALYHTMMQPNVAMDVDGQYRGRDNQLHYAKGFTYYSVFSLWDTFRAAHPLYTLIDKKRTADFINTFLAQYEQGGRLPVWELASNETDCMIGYHSVSVMADAMAKGIKGFDYEKAFQAAKHSAMLDHLGLDAYKRNGFISIDDEHESVSKTLEYAYDDWCIAQMAKYTGHKADYEYFMMRSQNWKNLFDPTTKHMRPKRNGGWETPFDPREINNNFTEGNSWQYSFFVLQDIAEMVEAYGGQEAFEAKLDEMFSAPSATTGREQVDVTGLIGQYAHGNEPSHHMAYLYNYVGKPEKTQKWVRYILDNFYKNTPDGLIGNEDCGQMSAWYVLSSLGIYNVTPGQPYWTTTTPYFEKATLNLEGDVKVVITKDTKYEDMRSVGFPNLYSGNISDASGVLIPVPVIKAPSTSFSGSMDVSFEGANPSDNIYYRVNDARDSYLPPYQLFKSPVTVSQRNAIVSFYAERALQNSDTIRAYFFKKPNNYTIAIKSKYDKQYSAGGDDALLNGIHGSTNWRKGDWQGYQAQDFEAVVDLQKVQDVHSISASFLQDTRAWIILPTRVEFFTSIDGVTYTPAGSATHTVDPHNYEVLVKELSATLNTKARYVKVKAYNFGTLPQWHQGAGGDAYIFTDEITVK
ncbi:GH92 family glycosyl hydrolase [Flavobacterium sp. RHBU_3]|uniref:GH92 family glycosyl hydrolase n=1 Tax=Flavobacterium sp. RHBU_3 TaxID=3391184 RepID=UPI0039847604